MINLRLSLILLFLLLVTRLLAQQELKFSNINIKNGLSHSNVLCVLQDKKGFMWFGTRDGLNRYDGYQVKVYRNVPGDTRSISYNQVSYLFEDSKGVLWIGTYGGGINKYDRDKDSFEQLKHKDKDPSSLSNDFVNSINEDKNGIIWISTFAGIDSYRDSKKFTHYNYKTSATGNAKIFIACSVVEDELQNLWVATQYEGLNIFDRKTKLFKPIHDKTNTIKESYPWRIYHDKKKRLWVGTRSGGFYLFNASSGIIKISGMIKRTLIA